MLQYLGLSLSVHRIEIFVVSHEENLSVQFCDIADAFLNNGP